MNNFYGRFDFDNWEAQAKERNLSDEQLQAQAVDYLRSKVDTTINWDELQGKSAQEAYTALKENNNFTINTNNPNKPTHIKTKGYAIAQAQNAEDEFNKQGTLDKLALGGSMLLDQFTGFQTERLRDYKRDIDKKAQDLIDAGVPFDELPTQAKELLEKKQFIEGNPFSNVYAMAKKGLNKIGIADDPTKASHDTGLQANKLYKELSQKKIDAENAGKSYNEILENLSQNLTESQRELLKSEIGLPARLMRDEKEELEFFLHLQNAREASPQVLKLLSMYQNVNPNEQFMANLFNTPKEEQERVIKDYAFIAQNLGFDEIAYNKNGLYFIKDAKAYKIESTFGEDLKNVLNNNKGSIAAGIAGAWHGAKRGNFAAMVREGAIGAFLGGSVDSLLADAMCDKDFDIAQALLHGAQEAGLNIAGDLAFKGVATTYKALKGSPSKFGNIAGKIADYTPIVGFAKRAKDGNAQAVQKLIDSSVTPEQQKVLKETMENFGGELDIAQAQAKKDLISQKFGEDSFIAKGYNLFSDTFALKDQREAQKNFIRAIRADESGNLTAFITEAANASPKTQIHLKKMLYDTTKNLQRHLDNIGLKPDDMREVFNTLEVGTKQSYSQAMEDILGKVYDDSYKTILPKENYTKFRKELESSGVLPEDSMRFLNFVEKSIYNEKGVSFEQLNNGLKNINSYYKQAQDPNFKSHIKNAVEKFIKSDIKKGIDDIFSQNKELYNDATALFETALRDYSNMKDTIKMVDKLKIRDQATSYQKALDNTLKFLQAQGKVDESNFTLLTKNLSPEDKARFEISFLDNLFRNSLKQIDDSKMVVFDSNEFFKRLESLGENLFSSPYSKDYIAIAKDFHTLFKNDSKIAQGLRAATPDKVGSSIATTLEGAVKFQVIKGVFGEIIRLMPHIPFMKAFNEKVQGAALRFHIKKALSEAIDVQDFKIALNEIEHKPFTNETLEIVKRLKGEVSQGYDELQKVANPSLKQASEPLAEFGENYAEFYHDGKGAIAKLLETKSGQVAGAFEKEGLGDIDLVWGDSKMGLKHILERRSAEFGEQKAKEIIDKIPEIIKDGKIYKQADDKIELITDKYTLALGLREDRKFIITTLRDSRNAKRMETIQTRVADGFTDETLANKPLSSNQVAENLAKDNSTTKTFKMSDVSINNAEDLTKWSQFLGLDLAGKESEALKYIKGLDKAGLLEC